MERGGFVVDHHSSDFFPERFFDLVVVLQTDNTLLYDRLQKRGYAARKIQENVQCEIMHVPCEEARRSYKEEIVQACTLPPECLGGIACLMASSRHADDSCRFC